MPRIRYEFIDFVKLWNSHRIRKQRNRTHVVSGKPYCLWSFSKATDCRVPVPPERLAELQRIVDWDKVDLDEYLPQSTMDTCNNIVASWGELPNTVSKDQPYLEQYIRLKDALKDYDRAETEPRLSLVEHPIGGLDHIRSFFDEQCIDLDRVHQMDREKINIGF